ncbi:metallophosphoesterase [Vibrio harveyi]|uniref:metallophosphoesterase family protein n=1 Tax=Vibrio harveyi TaxID=669 RepID=UPI00028CDA50|nr:metallophosphoesterase [Vibrio harveyi]EKM16364.1 calcineurin-like phosphoesterase family protein [Vibrio harveyi]
MTSIIQISDCHLSDDSSFENLRSALLYAQKDSSCDTLLLTGDLCCNPKPGDYRVLLSFLEKHIRDKKIFAIAGNHDDTKLMKRELVGSSINVVNKAKIHNRDMLFLDSSAKPLDKRHPLGSGRVDNRGLARFNKQLRHAINPIVVIHHPIIPVGSDWMQAICLENNASLHALLSKYRVQDVICGHGHDALTVTRQEVTQHMAPATAYGFDHSIDEYNRNAKIGVNKIHLESERMKVETVWL